MCSAWDTAFGSDRPVLIEDIPDQDVPPLPPYITCEQATRFSGSLLHEHECHVDYHSLGAGTRQGHHISLMCYDDRSDHDLQDGCRPRASKRVNRSSGLDIHVRAYVWTLLWKGRNDADLCDETMTWNRLR